MPFPILVASPGTLVASKELGGGADSLRPKPILLCRAAGRDPVDSEKLAEREVRRDPPFREEERFESSRAFLTTGFQHPITSDGARRTLHPFEKAKNTLVFT